MATNYKPIIEALEQAMLSNVGVRSVTVDGQTIQFEDKLKLAELLEYYKRQQAKASGRKPLFRGFDLGSAW